MHRFKMLVYNGFQAKEIGCDSFRVEFDDGEWVEMSPRLSDGELRITAKNFLSIKPVASNSVSVDSILPWSFNDD